MGNWFSNIFGKLFGEDDIRILILGLDNAGKTTILYQMHVGEVVTTIPSMVVVVVVVVIVAVLCGTRLCSPPPFAAAALLLAAYYQKGGVPL